MIGVDEVGRGAWAGPLLVCAVRLHGPIVGLKDSKKLSAKIRERLDHEIKASADIGFGWVAAKEIDNIGLAAALKRAANRALKVVQPLHDEIIIIDGTVNFVPHYKGARAVVRADDLYPCVSAASIVAKVARDAHMVKLAQTIPGYRFEKHVGYGTKHHTQALQKNGPSSEHRLSFKLPA